MGQYHIPVNLDRKEFLNPHSMGDGLKLMEQALSGGGGTGSGLLLLLAASNGDGGRGGGDYHQEDPNGIVGRWAGERIALVGDYAELEDLPEEFGADLIYDLCSGLSAAEVAQDYRKYAQEMFDRRGPNESSENSLAKADRIEKLESFTDITDMVTAALEADGYVRYKRDEYGLMNRYLQGEEGFEDNNTKGWYRVVVEPLDSGVMEGVTEFKWLCNHYNHAVNKAKKRGLTPTSIIFLGEEG